MNKIKNVMVLGGAGYIGSHMLRTLIANKYNPIVFDNLSTGHRNFLPKGVQFFKGDLRKGRDLERFFSNNKVDAVMHFAASIVVPESVCDPLKYYENNVVSSINLLNSMKKNKVNLLVFSSTAAVYGEPQRVPILESDQLTPTNPYGGSKRMVEEILISSSQAYSLKYIALRYFNVAGSHPIDEIGIKHKVVSHLIPSILKVAIGERKEFLIFGDDYPTADGTCIRDYIYVMDLCQAHLLALQKLASSESSNIFNLGNEVGYSVKQVLTMAEKVTGKKIPFKVVPRRLGDPSKIVASSQKARKVLGWKPETGLEKIIQTAWRWEQFLNK